MPGPIHQNLVLLFRNHLQLIVELAQAAGVPLRSNYDELRELQTEIDDPLRPGNTLQIDVTVAAYRENQAQGAIILEIQIEEDPGKQWSMLLYRAGIRYRLRCSAWNLLFSPQRHVLVWARDELFREEPELAPYVITPELIPPITTLEAALADYPRAVLAIVLHRDGPHAVVGATVAIQALLRLSPRYFGRYIQLVADSVAREVMHQVRQQLPQPERHTLSEWERRSSSFSLGREEGVEEGLERGLERGLHTAILRVLTDRGFDIDEQTRARILACDRSDDLESLAGRAGTIAALDELFA